MAAKKVKEPKKAYTFTLLPSVVNALRKAADGRSMSFMLQRAIVDLLESRKS